MKSCALVEIAEINYGRSPAGVTDNYGMYPVIGTGGEYGRANSYIHNFGIVVPRKGSLGNPQIINEPFWPTDTTYSVIPKGRIDANWLFYSLLTFDLTKLNEATGVPSISRDWLSRIRLLVPTYDVQCKIANIIKTIDRNIEKTEALIEKYQQIKAGLMHDLFTRGIGADGKLRSPREEAPELYQQTVIGWIPKDWQVKRLDSLLANVPNNLRSGPFGSALLKSELVQNGVPFLGIDNIFPERFEDSFKRFVSEKKFLQLSKYAVRTNDVVITIMGTVGRAALVPAHVTRALSSKHLWTMTFDPELMQPDLVCWQLNSSAWVESWFRKHSQGGVMDAIQSRTLRELLLPVPQIDEQKLILKQYFASNENLKTESDILVKLKKQKAGLMQDLLTGNVSVKLAPAEQVSA